MKDPELERAEAGKGPAPSKTEISKGFDPRSFLATFIIMAGLWVIFSSKFDMFHLSLGVLSCFLVAMLSSDLMFPSGFRVSTVRRWMGICMYIPWLLYQIFLANLHVLRLAFHPRMMELIDPKIIEFDSRLKSDFSRTIFANSITLTPGTITVNVSALGRFSVHCIDAKSGEPLPGDMEARVARVFEE